MKIKIELDDSGARAALRRLIDLGSDLSPVMKDIGGSLLNSTRKRFADEKDLDGKPWTPLSKATLARKRKRKDGKTKILTESGDLGGGISYRVDRNAVEIGSRLVYASVHQHGAKKGQFGKTRAGSPIPWGRIPARRFLGMSDQDRKRAVNKLADEVRRRVSSA